MSRGQSPKKKYSQRKKTTFFNQTLKRMQLEINAIKQVLEQLVHQQAIK
jgi:hypothetical protein